jgi:hypothetical protein
VPLSGAAGIDEQDPVALEHVRLVGVTADHDPKSRGRRFEVDLLHVVKNVDTDPFEAQRESHRERRGPATLVVVPSYGVHGSDGAQCRDDLRPADISGVDGPVHSREHP